MFLFSPPSASCCSISHGKPYPGLWDPMKFIEVPSRSLIVWCHYSPIASSSSSSSVQLRSSESSDSSSSISNPTPALAFSASASGCSSWAQDPGSAFTREISTRDGIKETELSSTFMTWGRGKDKGTREKEKMKKSTLLGSGSGGDKWQGENKNVRRRKDGGIRQHSKGEGKKEKGDREGGKKGGEGREYKSKWRENLHFFPLQLLPPQDTLYSLQSGPSFHPICPPSCAPLSSLTPQSFICAWNTRLPSKTMWTWSWEKRIMGVVTIQKVRTDHYDTEPGQIHTCTGQSDNPDLIWLPSSQGTMESTF